MKAVAVSTFSILGLSAAAALAEKPDWRAQWIGATTNNAENTWSIFRKNFRGFEIQCEELCHSKMNTMLPKTEAAPARKRVRSKYIIIKHAGTEVPLVFSPVLSHKQVAGMTEAASLQPAA